MTESGSTHSGFGPAESALSGRCPRCGEKTLFGGLTNFAEQCRACGLDYSQYNVGDGPAAFLTMVIGALVLALALVLEFSFNPPFWVHVLLWVPLTAAAVVFGLRFAKALLLIIEYRNDAHEGRRDQ